jgi:hypothetical protein
MTANGAMLAFAGENAISSQESEQFNFTPFWSAALSPRIYFNS